MYGEFTALTGMANINGEDAQYFAGRVETGFRELIAQLRLLMLVAAEKLSDGDTVKESDAK